MTWTAEQLERSISYKPGFRFFFNDAGDRIVMHLDEQTECSRVAGKKVTQGYTAVYVKGSGDPRIYIREMIRRYEYHEIDEWLKFDGELLFDPHAKGVDPDPQDTTP